MQVYLWFYSNLNWQRSNLRFLSLTFSAEKKGTNTDRLAINWQYFARVRHQLKFAFIIRPLDWRPVVHPALSSILHINLRLTALRLRNLKSCGIQVGIYSLFFQLHLNHLWAIFCPNDLSQQVMAQTTSCNMNLLRKFQDIYAKFRQKLLNVYQTWLLRSLSSGVRKR